MNPQSTAFNHQPRGALRQIYVEGYVMGSIRKRGAKWYAEVCRKGRRQGRTCRTKAEAMAWVVEAEAAIEDGPDRTVGDLFDRYKRTHSVHKPTAAQDAQRADRLAEALGRDTSLRTLSSDDLARWRDDRLAEVKPASVRRDWNLLGHALGLATREWGWLKANPLANLKRPAPAKPRTRVWSDGEVEAFLHCCGWPGDTLQARVGDCLLFALETGMRAGEIVGLRPEHIHDRHVHLPRSKNGHARDVPLTARAGEILTPIKGRDPVFGLTSRQLDVLFRKARDRAALVDLRFHDARRTALTRLSRRLDALELARISGHRDLRILLDTYYAPSTDDLADKLNAGDDDGKDTRRTD